MAPKKQKVVASRQPGRKPRQPKSQSATPVPATTTATVPKLVIKLKYKSGARESSQPPVSAYQFPLSAPPSDDASEKEHVRDKTLLGVDVQSSRRGARQRTKAHQPDMVFGSEMDKLITSSATIGKVEDKDNVHMVSSPPAIISMRAPAHYDSFETIQDHNSPQPRYPGPDSQDVYSILGTLRSSSNIQVDLPDLFADEGTGVVKLYTASLLTELYIHCYQNRLWHFCDLIADTYIRALQKVNKLTHKSKNVQDHMWRKNVALEKKFSEKKKGFKEDVFEFGLEVEDPDMAADITNINPERLCDLYTHTSPRCGIRLLWADAMALCGKKMEHEILKRPGTWPEEFFFDLMCTSLRLVGRKLTLKIEETYEGAWCRYHEHGKHRLPCYRELAWQQKQSRGEEKEDGGAADAETGVNRAKGKKRAREVVFGGEESDAKRVRFDDGSPREGIIDSGNTDA